MLSKYTKIMAKKKNKIDPSFQISEEAFESYKPKINHLERAKADKSIADEDVTSFGGCMYETHGEDLDYIKDLVKNGKGNTVWTILDNGGNLTISSGFSFVNRMGYLVTETPWEKEGIEVFEEFSKGGSLNSFQALAETYRQGGKVGRVKKEKWGKHDLYPMYSNVTDLAADILDYFEDITKDIDKSYSDQMKEFIIKALQTNKI